MKRARLRFRFGVVSTFRFRKTEASGEDRNRTCPGSCEPTTVLKTARATRHPSLSRKENIQRSTPNIERRISEEEKDEGLLKLFDLADHFVEVGPIAGIELGMEEFAIGLNFKSASARRDERERFDVFAEFKNFGRQTDGLRRVVSNDAVFDRNLSFHAACSFPKKMVRSWTSAVKGGKNEA
jgi:hypothetical protein